MSFFGRPNIYTPIDDTTSKLTITSKTHGIIDCLIDTEDIPRMKAFHWAVAKIGHGMYVSSSIGNRHTGCRLNMKLHRLITSFNWDIVDHINRNGLDNRKTNLREATHQGNTSNSRSFKSNGTYRGVKINKSGKCYPNIKVNGEYKYLGVYYDAVSAAKAYDEAARKYHGEFAYQNFPTQKDNL